MKKIALLSILALASIANADRPYGTGGCGLGSMVMGKDDNQILAATTNDSSSQSFAISSGTSNCVKSGTVKPEKEVTMFIELHHGQIASEAARGQGESLATLAGMLGCKDSKQFGNEMKTQFDTIFSGNENNPANLEQSIRSAVQTGRLQSTCS